eukprot:jgi/Psemu1/24203/gm1.24203_g
MIAPIPASWDEVQRRKLVDKILDDSWENPNAGYEIQPTDEWIVNNQQQQQLGGNSFDILEQDMFGNGDDYEGVVSLATLEKPSTYGEITPLGARQLFGAMGLLGDSTGRRGRQRQQQQQQSAHFFDLGSGAGKLVGQAVLELPDKTIEKATGIELSPSRHESAINAREALLRWPRSHSDRSSFAMYPYISSSNGNSNYFLSEENFVRSTNKLELLQGDMFDVDISTATHIYIASLCFPHTLMLRLEEQLKLIMQSPESQEHSDSEEREMQRKECSLQWVATLQPFPNHLGGIRPTIRFMEMSWTKPLGCAVYLYRCSDNNGRNRDDRT